MTLFKFSTYVWASVWECTDWRRLLVSRFKRSGFKDNCFFLSILFAGELQFLTIARFTVRAGLMVWELEREELLSFLEAARSSALCNGILMLVYCVFLEYFFQFSFLLGFHSWATTVKLDSGKGSLRWLFIVWLGFDSVWGQSRLKI